MDIQNFLSTGSNPVIAAGGTRFCFASLVPRLPFLAAKGPVEGAKAVRIGWCITKVTGRKVYLIKTSGESPWVHRTARGGENWGLENDFSYFNG